MALVMLPSDLPWWDSVKRLLKKIGDTKNSVDLIEKMQKIYEMCNVSLEPDEESADPQQFAGFMNFLDNDLTNEERNVFFSKTLPNLVARALKIKDCRPKSGLHFSLQQQADSTELEYSFVSSLIANAFFSTFPKRTEKTHPTLQNFNFADFFKSLNSTSQKSKLKSILYYFEWLANNEHCCGHMRILRQVMGSKEWLTIEDWLECNLPLCTLKIRHDGKLDRSEEECLQICFSSAKVGGNVLNNGYTQECINLVTAPELLTTLLNVEALEDNEVLTVEGVRHISRILDPKHRAFLEKFDQTKETTVCCIDAEDYTKLPIGQYEEDNILRELNKCLLGFQQKQLSKSEKESSFLNRRRLSPIGESMGSNQSDCLNVPLITQQSCSTTHSGSISPIRDNNNMLNDRLCVQLERERNLQKRGKPGESVVHGRRGRFIVLGSSGECLPITRKPVEDETRSSYDSCESSEGEFHSAKTSLDDASEDENFHKRYSIDLETPERRNMFAQRLRDALRKEISEISNSTVSSTEESSYAVGISVTGSNLEDTDIRLKRGGSTGFALNEDSFDDHFLENSLNQEKEWIDKFRSKQSSVLNRKESNKSSEYSFSTEYSSELEEVYEQFSKWLENPLLETEGGTKRELDARELAVVRFAGSILKRTLSESFVGIPVPLTEGCDTHSGSDDNYCTKKNKLVLNAKSLSLELARHKHRLAAQLSEELEPDSDRYVSLTKSENEEALASSSLTKTKAWFITCVTEAIVQTLEDISVSLPLSQDTELSQLSAKPNNGLKPVSTGNWGCGSSRKGDVQLKVVIQWMAASVAGVPALIYCTYGHQQLAKLDTVCRILIDRKWSVKDLAQATLRYSKRVIQGKELSGTLFEELIGMDRTVQ